MRHAHTLRGHSSRPLRCAGRHTPLRQRLRHRCGPQRGHVDRSGGKLEHPERADRLRFARPRGVLWPRRLRRRARLGPPVPSTHHTSRRRRRGALRRADRRAGAARARAVLRHPHLRHRRAGEVCRPRRTRPPAGWRAASCSAAPPRSSSTCMLALAPLATLLLVVVGRIALRPRPAVDSRERGGGARRSAFRWSRFKLLAFVLSAVDSRHGRRRSWRCAPPTSSSAQVFDPMISVTVIAMALIGGGDDARGPILGTLFLFIVSEMLWVERAAGLHDDSRRLVLVVLRAGRCRAASSASRLRAAVRDA